MRRVSTRVSGGNEQFQQCMICPLFIHAWLRGTRAQTESQPCELQALETRTTSRYNRLWTSIEGCLWRDIGA